MSETLQKLIKSIAVDGCLLLLVLLAYFLFSQSPIASQNVLMSLTFGSLYYYITIGLIGIVALDLSNHVAPFVAPGITRRYTGKTIANWETFFNTVASVLVLIALWIVLRVPIHSLADELNKTPQRYPNALTMLYHLFFGLVIAYCAISGTLRSRTTGFTEPKEIAGTSWDAREQAVKMSRYLRRLDALRSLGEIDERIHDQLRTEYEQKLREAIESP